MSLDVNRHSSVAQNSFKSVTPLGQGHDGVDLDFADQGGMRLSFAGAGGSERDELTKLLMSFNEVFREQLGEKVRIV